MGFLYHLTRKYQKLVTYTGQETYIIHWQVVFFCEKNMCHHSGVPELAIHFEHHWVIQHFDHLPDSRPMQGKIMGGLSWNSLPTRDINYINLNQKSVKKKKHYEFTGWYYCICCYFFDSCWCFIWRPPGSTASTRPVHCSVSAWTSWSACSEGCGSGVRSRQRHEVLAPNSLGRCPTGWIWIRSGVGGVLWVLKMWVKTCYCLFLGGWVKMWLKMLCFMFEKWCVDWRYGERCHIE